jgi:hypothetical protein
LLFISNNMTNDNFPVISDKNIIINWIKYLAYPKCDCKQISDLFEFIYFNFNTTTGTYLKWV